MIILWIKITYFGSFVLNISYQIYILDNYLSLINIFFKVGKKLVFKKVGKKQ